MEICRVVDLTTIFVGRAVGRFRAATQVVRAFARRTLIVSVAGTVVGQGRGTHVILAESFCTLCIQAAGFTGGCAAGAGAGHRAIPVVLAGVRGCALGAVRAGLTAGDLVFARKPFGIQDMVAIFSLCVAILVGDAPTHIVDTLVGLALVRERTRSARRLEGDAMIHKAELAVFALIVGGAGCCLRIHARVFVDGYFDVLAACGDATEKNTQTRDR